MIRSPLDWRSLHLKDAPVTQEEIALAYFDARRAAWKADEAKREAEQTKRLCSVAIAQAQTALDNLVHGTQPAGDSGISAAVNHAKAVLALQQAEEALVRAADSRDFSVKTMNQLLDELIATCKPSG